MLTTSKIYVAGHRGLAGSSITRRLQRCGYNNLVLRTHEQLDLTNPSDVGRFFEAERPEYVFLAAAKVGGILVNSKYPVDFLRINLLIQVNLLDAAWKYGVKKIQVLGSSCIYPKFANQPIREDSLLTGALEPSNQWYAIAKIAGLKLAQAYREQHSLCAISLMPTNLYGPGDNFDLETSHVLAALVRKFDDARQSGASSVTLWGTGTPRREFLYIDDFADAAVFLMLNYDSQEIINVGVGEDIEIRDLARMVAEVVGFRGEIVYDPSKPDGTPRKLLDVQRLHNLGWRAKTGLREGIEKTYLWYRQRAAGAAP
jgi:GDP-L-fucose synthase